VCDTGAGNCSKCKKIASLKTTIQELHGLINVSGMLEEAGFEGINCRYYDEKEFVELKSKQKDYLSFFHLNIASLNAHYEELKTLLHDLTENFNVIGITETRLGDTSLPDSLSLSNYNSFHTPRVGQCGGSLLYVSKDMDVIHRPDLEKMLHKPENLETSFVEIPREKQKNIIVGCIYRHHSLSVEDFTENYINPLLTKVEKEKKLVVLMGDFNINLMEVTGNTDISTFFDTLGSCSLMPNILLPTRITDTSQTIIDNIFSSPELSGTASGNILTCISDHLAQFAFINNTVISTPPKIPQIKRDWSKFNGDKFTSDIRSTDWPDILQLNLKNPNISMESFLKRIESLLDQYAPLKQFTPKKFVNLKQSPWMTNGILNSMNTRDKLYKSYIRKKDPVQKELAKERYKAFRNRIVTLCRNQKTAYYKDFFLKNLQNAAEIWKGINSIVSIKKKISSAKISLVINDEETSDPTKVAKKFNLFFTTVAEDIKKDIPKTPKSYKDFLKKRNKNSLKLSATTPEEVLECLEALDSSKANGPASIPTKALDLIKTEISAPLSEIINLTFETGIFPEILKTAKVLPVFKNKGEITDCTNYRPISLLSNMDKVLEKLIYKRAYSFLDNSKLLYIRQFGFRRKHSTVHTLTNLCQKIADALDNHKYACGVFVDLQKAFDTVDHNILLAKLGHYGIRGKAHKLFESYLTDRRQFVTVSGQSSPERIIKHGVPQGSVLGPLLFLIYINDLNYAIKFSLVHHFADDTNLLIITDNLETLTEQMNQDLQSLWHWLNANKISLNASKTEYVLFRHPTKKLNNDLVKLYIGGYLLSEKNTIKYLGVHVDSDLKWNTQVNNTAGKLRKANGIISKIRHYAPNETCKLVYYAIFYSHLMYCSQVWGQYVKGVSTTLLKRIITLQNHAVRLLTFSNFRAHVSPLYKYLNLLKFTDIVQRQNVLFLHDIYNGKIPPDVIDTFKIDFSHFHNTRASARGQINSVHKDTTTYGTASIRNQSIDSWNKCQMLFPKKQFFEMSESNIKEVLTSEVIKSY